MATGERSAPAVASSPFETAGSLTIKNALISGITSRPIIGWLRSTLTVSNSIFRNNSFAILLADHNATFDNVLFENNSTASTSSYDGSVLRTLREGKVTIRNSIIPGQQRRGWRPLHGLGASLRQRWRGDAGRLHRVQRQYRQRRQRVQLQRCQRLAHPTIRLPRPARPSSLARRAACAAKGLRPTRTRLADSAVPAAANCRWA